MTTISEYIASRELFNNLTLRELRGKYKRSVLGWAWSLLNPLASMVIFTVVFRFFLKVPPPVGHGGLRVFALFLLCGLLPWNYMQNGVNGAIGALIGNANLIKKTYFPRELLVAASVGSALVSHAIEMGLLSVALIAFGNVRLLLYLPMVIFLIAVLTIFTVGLGLLLSIANVYFRDIQHFTAILFQIWFYMTPIVYPLTFVPKHMRILGMTLPVLRIYRLNPMVGFTEAFRASLYRLTPASVYSLAYLVIASSVMLFIGLALFNRLEGRLAEEL
jgi:ABC-2 type transport system permease protein